MDYNLIFNIMEVRAKTHYYDSSMSKSKNMFKD